MTILLAYASAHGSTKEVAEVVADELRAAALEVEVRPAAEPDSVLEHDAVLLGSALYMGRLHGDARRFLGRHRRALAQRPFAVFALGPKSLDAADVESAHRQLAYALRRYPDLEPVATAIFGGVVDPAKLRFPLDRLPASDARDWDAIAEWARALPARLAGAPVAA